MKRRGFHFSLRRDVLAREPIRMNPAGWIDQLNHQFKLKSKLSPLISHINIPGTHESASHCGQKLAKRFFICNAYTILEQLNMGYRWFDIRLKLQKGEFGVFHGKSSLVHKYQGITWINLHNMFKEFLSKPVSKNECIMVKVKNEAGKNHDDFAEGFAAMIGAFQRNEIAGIGDDIYYLKRAIPRLSECAGKVIILGDPKWAEHDHWQRLHPVQWIDVNPSKKSDAAIFSEKGKKKRYDKWEAALKQSIRSIYGTEIHRHGIAANSKSVNKLALSGDPLQWAKIMNPLLFNTIRSISFRASSGGKRDICLPKFYGIVAVDLPQRNDNQLLAQEIPALVIMTNCLLYKRINRRYKDWNDPNAIIQGLDHEKKSLARNVNYGVNIIDDDDVYFGGAEDVSFVEEFGASDVNHVACLKNVTEVN